MATPHTPSGEIVDVRPPGGTAGPAITATHLVKAAALEAIRLAVPAGKETPAHTAPGDITVQCLEGVVEFTAAGRARRLSAGQLLFLAAGTLHAVRGVEDAALLLTVVRREPGGP